MRPGVHAWRDTWAQLSDNGMFRLALGRHWNADKPQGMFVMLNPSTADGEKDDPTIRKCIGFAQRMDWGGFTVVNLFSFRATEPSDLKRAGWPGADAENDEVIVRYAREVHLGGGRVVAAWGAHARGLRRAEHVARLITGQGIDLWALKLLAGGVPAHPLMLPYSCMPVLLLRGRVDPPRGGPSC